MVARHWINLKIYQSIIKAKDWQISTKCWLKFAGGLNVRRKQVQRLVSPCFLSFSVLKLSISLHRVNGS